MTPPSISFFIPPSLWPDQLPTGPNQNWAGYGLGLYAWTVQTYMWLKAAGIACELTSQLPAEGIVFCHSNALRTVEIAPAAKRLLNYTPEKILRKWEVFLEVIAVPAYAEWCEYSPRQRQQVLIATQSASYLDRAIRKGRGFLFEALSA